MSPFLIQNQQNPIQQSTLYDLYGVIVWIPRRTRENPKFSFFFFSLFFPFYLSFGSSFQLFFFFFFFFVAKQTKIYWKNMKTSSHLVKCHVGMIATMGHYTAYSKNPVDDRWYYYNDDSVTLVNENTENRKQKRETERRRTEKKTEK